jgi:hypothetical protein
MTATALASLASITHAQRVTEARHDWTSTLAHGAQFELSDPEVEDALRGRFVLLLACRERRGSSWVPIGGPFHYRDVWLRDGARLIAALSVAGFNEEARDLVGDSGSSSGRRARSSPSAGSSTAPARHLWAFEQALLRPAPADSIARYAEAALAAWKWLSGNGTSSGSPGGSSGS